MSTTTASCPSCGADLAVEARFCAQCGTRVPGADGTAVLDTPPHETGRAPVSAVHEQPRFYGVTPPIAVLVLSVAAAAVGVLLLVQGSALAGALLVLGGVVLAALFLVLAKREAVRNARERAGSAWESIAVRGRARQEVLRLRSQLHLLAEERERWFAELGRAVYAGDEGQVEAAHEELRRRDEAIAEKEAQMSAVAETAEARIRESRMRADTTNVIQPPSDPGGPVTVPEPGPATVPEPYPPPDEGDPPQPAPVPEPYPPDEAEPPQQQR